MTTAPDLSLLLYGWAPGDCTPKCFDCSGRHHNSDKQSMRCRPCAEKVRDDHTAGKGGAIAAQERERCAVMAETHEWFVGGIGTVAPGSGQAKAIAAAIRAVAPLTTAAEPEQCHKKRPPSPKLNGLSAAHPAHAHRQPPVTPRTPHAPTQCKSRMRRRR